MRNLRIFGLALALLMGVSCTADMPLGTDGGGDTQPVAGTPPGNPGTGAPTDGGTGTPPDSPSPPPDSTPTPADSSPAPADSTPTPADSGSTPDKTTLLACQLQEYAVTTAVIGPQGGEINVGNHSLKIYANALSQDVTITAEQVEGDVSSVRLSPEGLQFAVPAELLLSYNNCATVPRVKRVVYTDETLRVLELTPSLDITASSQVRGLINHFSRYAVAY